LQGILPGEASAAIVLVKAMGQTGAMLLVEAEIGE
jgi:hypothetical protein